MKNLTLNTPQEEWLKILGKGMITIPKNWREELGLKKGEVVKARKTGNKVILEAQKTAPYRIYSAAEIRGWLKEDRLPSKLASQTDKKIESLKSV